MYCLNCSLSNTQHIPCLQTTLGRVTIQIDKVVTEGEYSGSLSLNHENSKDASSRSLDIEIAWSNRTTDETH